MSGADDNLARLGEELSALIASGAEPDVDALAKRFGVSPADVEDTITALGALAEPEDEVVPADRIAPPHLPADYEVIDEIGRGGMGVVYRVRQLSLDRIVAVKVLRPGDLMFGEAIRRFEKEAKSLAKLRHPHIVSVFEVGRADGHVWFSMDLVEGESLAARVRRGAMTTSEAVRTLRQVADAVAYTHSRGIVHRDLKPENILIDPAGDAYVVDFGLARDIAVESDLTVSGRILGTPAYMSPEQARGDVDRIGEGSDVYALGAILYECLTGRSPFAGRPLADLIHAVVHEEPVRPAKRNPRVPKALEAICLKALAKEPHRRYATARAMAEDLSAFAEGKPVRARAPGPLAPARRFLSRHRAAVLTGSAVTAVLMLLFLTVVLPMIGRTPENRLLTAEEMLAQGEYRAAEVLVRDVLDEIDDVPPRRTARGGIPADTVHGRAHRVLAAALADRGRQRLEAGDADGALALLDEALRVGNAAFPYHGWREKADALIDRAWALARRGDWTASANAVNDLEGWDRNVRHREKRDPRPLVDRLAGALTAPIPDDSAVWLWLNLETGGEWLLEQETAGIPVLLAGIRVSVRLPKENRGRGHYFALKGLAMSIARGPHRRELEKRLFAAVTTLGWPEEARGFALMIFLRVADLPMDLYPGAGQWPGWDEGLARAATGLWNRLLGAGEIEAYQERVRAAILVDHGPHWGNRIWIEEHTGAKGDLVSWWAEHGGEDPREWLARAGGLGGPVVEIPVEDVLRKLERSHGVTRWMLHRLLAFLVPEGTEHPVWLWREAEPQSLAARWWEAIRSEGDADGGQSWRLRIAHFTGSDGHVPSIQLSRFQRIRVGQRDEYGASWTSRRTWTERITVPGLGAEGGPPAHTDSIQGSIAFEWRDRGLTLDIGGESLVEMVAVVNRPFDWSGPKRTGEMPLTFALACVEPPGFEAPDWTVEDWRRRLEESIAFLAEGLEREDPDDPDPTGRFSYRYHQSLGALPQVASCFPLPGALDDMRRMPPPDRTHPRPASWLPARLLAGDATVLDADESRVELHRALDGFDLDVTYWTRVLITAEDPAVREYAAARLAEGELPEGPAAAIEAAFRKMALDVPAPLRSRIEGAGRHSFWKEIVYVRPHLVAGLVLVLLTFVALLLALSGRPLGAAALTVCGLAFVGLDVYHGRADLLPDAAGLALAGLGCVLLLRHGNDWLARVPAVAFFLAAAAQSFGLPAPAGLATAVGVLFLPYLARAIDSLVPRKLFPVFWLLYGVPAALLWLGFGWARVRGFDLRIEGDWVPWVVFAATLGAGWAGYRLLAAAWRRGAGGSPG